MFDELAKELQDKISVPSIPIEYTLEDYCGEYDHQSD
jgi:hypothetical protein